MITTNTFLGIAANGMAAIATRGLTVASAVAVAIVWNEDIGPILGQPKEKRNALLGRLERRLTDKGMNIASVATWRKHGVRFATNYSADIENLINNARGDNESTTGAEYVALVVAWARQRFPTLQDFNDDVSGRMTKTDDEKALVAARKLLNAVNTCKLATLLLDVERIAAARGIILNQHATVAAKTEAQATATAILNNYKDASEQDADDAMSEAPDMDNVVTMPLTISGTVESENTAQAA